MRVVPFLYAFVPAVTVLIGYWIGGLGYFLTPVWLLAGIAVLD